MIKKLILFSYTFLMLSLFLTGNISHAIPGAVKTMNLTSEAFDGRSLVYTYVDDIGNERNLYFDVPLYYLNDVKKSSDPVQTAKNQIAAAYTIFNLKDRLGQLNNTYLISLDVAPSIEPNFKVRFANENTEALKYAEKAKVNYKEGSDIYETTRDRLTPIVVPKLLEAETTPLPSGEPTTIRNSGSSSNKTLIGFALIIILVGGGTYAVIRKKGVK